MDQPRIAERPGTSAEDEIRSLLERARRGDPAAVPALRRALEAHPEIWRACGDLAAHARDAWIGLAAGPDLVLKESLARQADSIRAGLAGPAPSPLEALLVDRVVACWVQLAYSDAAAAQMGEVSIKQAEHARKRQDSAHRRYVTAIGALATVRKLLGVADDATDSSGARPSAAYDARGEIRVGLAR